MADCSSDVANEDGRGVFTPTLFLPELAAAMELFGMYEVLELEFDNAFDDAVATVAVFDSGW